MAVTNHTRLRTSRGAAHGTPSRMKPAAAGADGGSSDRPDPEGTELGAIWAAVGHVQSLVVVCHRALAAREDGDASDEDALLQDVIAQLNGLYTALDLYIERRDQSRRADAARGTPAAGASAGRLRDAVRRTRRAS
jgi:hypothetical protein